MNPGRMPGIIDDVDTTVFRNLHLDLIIVKEILPVTKNFCSMASDVQTYRRVRFRVFYAKPDSLRATVAERRLLLRCSTCLWYAISGSDGLPNMRAEHTSNIFSYPGNGRLVTYLSARRHCSAER
jgi:hypothetical protein